MYEEHDIIETFELEYQLAQMLLPQKWFYKFNRLQVTSAVIDRTANDGVIRISKTIERDRKQLRQIMKEHILFLHTGTWKQDKFVWQKAAMQLGMISEINATDVCECRLCGTLSPLTKYDLCVPCYEVNRAVRTNPDIAIHILKEMNKL